MSSKREKIGPTGGSFPRNNAWKKLKISGSRQENSFMNTHPDFEELLRLPEENSVDYMIVGGYAVAYHGDPRFTKDIDIFFNASEENATRLQKALVG